MDKTLPQLIDRLKRFKTSEREAIAKAAGVSKSLPRKLVYGERTNPCVGTIQPLFDYFAAVDSGRKVLPFVDQQQTTRHHKRAGA